MKLMRNVKKMWKTRDELSPRNFRMDFLPVFLALPLVVIIGDLRSLDQDLVFFSFDSNSLYMMFFGLGFLPVLFMKERHLMRLLRLAVLLQAPLLIMQLFMAPGFPRLFVYLAFHTANGVATACCFYFFAFMLNNVERLFSLLALQLYHAFTYVLWQYKSVPDFSLTFGSITVMLSLIAVVFLIKLPQSPEEQLIKTEPGARESGITAVIALNAVWYVITLMTMYVGYQDATASALPYGAGEFATIAVVFVVMLIFNYSALHLWSLCLVCSVLGIGALHYTPALAVNAGSLLYGLGEGLGFIVLFYLQGGALKRSGSFKLFRLYCLFSCLSYTVVSSVFYTLYKNLNAPPITLAFPAVLALTMICLLFLPILQDKLFRTNWTDGYHMVDMPQYAEALKQVEQIARASIPEGLTPREKEVCALLLKSLTIRQIAGELGLAFATVNGYYRSLYKKLGIGSKAELFMRFGAEVPAERAEEQEA